MPLQPTNQPASIDHRELQRRSEDRVAIFNPTSEDFTVGWDGYAYMIPNHNKNTTGYGPGIAVLPRYIAENALTHLTDKLILDTANQAIAKENEERVKARKQNPMNKWEEQPAFDRQMMTDNADKRREYARIIWKGVVEQSSSQLLPDFQSQRPQDLRPIDQQIIEELERPFVPEVQPTIANAKDEAVNEVAQ